jgi:polyhydroxybutyrate depolymerase
MKQVHCNGFGLALLLALAPITTMAESPSEGCGNDNLDSGSYTMDYDGLIRTFRVHVPRGYDMNTPAPLVMMYHGWGGDENDFLANKKVRSEADKRGYVLVAPVGLGSGSPDHSFNSWSFSGSWTGVDGNGGKICDDTITPDYSYGSCADDKQNSCSWTQCQQDDVAFTLELVREVGENLCIDQDRVFATGGSNGGMFAWELGQNPVSAPVFRAIAPVIGLPHRGYLAAPGKPGEMPVILITGTRDKTVPPGDWDDSGYTTTSNGDDRYYYTGATAITGIWAMAHGCEIGQDAVAFDAGVKRADCRTFCSGDAGWPRVLDCRARMGHSYGLPWSWKLILTFFDEHSD